MQCHLHWQAFGQVHDAKYLRKVFYPLGLELSFLGLMSCIKAVSYAFAMGNLKYVMLYARLDICLVVGIVSRY